ncbi:MAG: VTT domain-containing protein [Mogibacterium sp.]|nr:VTT domain-containing protein [Mogibacterium sp.]
MSNESSGKKVIAILKLILLVLIIAGIPAFLYLRYGSGVFSKDTASSMIDYLRHNRSIAFLLIIGLQIIQVVVCVLPGQPIQFAASYMFGVGRGYLLSVIGAVIGTTISFCLAKALGSEAMHLFFGEEKIKEYQRRLNSGRGLLLTFLIYLIPGVPKDLVSYAAGISEMRFRPFLLAATIGRSPAMLGSLLVGHFFVKQNYTAIIILTVIITVLLLVSFIKRDKLIAFLDMVEMKDAELEEKQNG